VGGSGLIVIVIVAAWALFLVPQWLHRRAEATARLADRIPEAELDDPADADADAGRRRRFGRRELTRRTAAPATRRRWLRRRPPRPAPTLESGAPRSSSGRPAAARRRRVLAVLAAATLLTAVAVGLAALLGLPVPAWLVAVPGSLMVGYLLLLALVHPATAAATTQRGREPQSLTSGSAATAPEPAVRPVPAMTSVPSAVEASVGGDLRGVPGLADVPDLRDLSADEQGTWTPVPLPVPTYVTAPRAPRSVRTIDLSNPGSWTAAPEATAADPTPAPDLEEADDSVVEHRRAVGD
jgi:hypothetical protein